MSEERIFNIALAGAGFISRTHAKNFSSIPGVKVLAVADLVKERREELAKEYEIPVQVDDCMKLCEIDEVDAIVVCLPNYLHAPMAINGLRAGKHVLTEKPMAINAEAARKMIEARDASGKTLMVTLQSRYGSMTQAAKKSSEDFGNIYYGRCAYMRRSGIPGWGSWFTKKEMSGGGPCADIGVHVLDRCMYLMGYHKPVLVSASTYSKFGPEGKGKGSWGYPEPEGYFDVEDLASAFIRLENGATIIMEASWATHKPDNQYVEVFGEKGGAVCSDKLTIYSEGSEGPVEMTPSLEHYDAGLAMSEHFIECCRTGRKPLTSPEHGLILSAIFDAMYESSSNGGRQVEVRL